VGGGPGSTDLHDVGQTFIRLSVLIGYIRFTKRQMWSGRKPIFILENCRCFRKVHSYTKYMGRVQSIMVQDLINVQNMQSIQ
jgi:hypothetical protein